MVLNSAASFPSSTLPSSVADDAANKLNPQVQEVSVERDTGIIQVAGVVERSLPSTAPVFCRLSILAAPDLARIEKESNSPPWSEKLFANEFANIASFTYGARHAGVLTGFVVCHAIIDEAHIINFAVARDFRKLGIGRGLFSYALQEFHGRGVRWVTLEVRKSNQVARHLYESLGFQEVGLRRGYYPDDQEDGVVMSLNIVDFVERIAHRERIE